MEEILNNVREDTLQMDIGPELSLKSWNELRADIVKRPKLKLVVLDFSNISIVEKTALAALSLIAQEVKQRGAAIQAINCCKQNDLFSYWEEIQNNVEITSFCSHSDLNHKCMIKHEATA